MATKRKKRADRRYRSSVSYVDHATGAKRVHDVYGYSVVELEANLQDVRERLRAGGPVKDASCTVAEWRETWEKTFLKASDRKQTTKDLYRYVGGGIINETIGHIPLARLRPSDVTRMLVALEEAGKSGSTRRTAYAALRGALDDAVSDGLLLHNPVSRVQRPKADSPESRALTPQEVKKFLTASADLRHHRAFVFMLATGVRRGEALGLRWEDVDLKAGTVRVKATLTGSGRSITLTTPKTKRSVRTLSLSPNAVAVLKSQRAAQATERLRAANLWSDEGFVFTTETGTTTDPKNFSRTLRLAAKKAGLVDDQQGKIGTHTLRHTFATTALLNGVPLHVVSRMLGHASISITADIYGHLTEEATHEAAARISAAMGL